MVWTVGFNINSANLSRNNRESADLWGARIITISGYEGSITLDEVAYRILKQPMSDKVNELKIINSLEKFYRITNVMLEKENWLTQRLNSIREFPLFEKSPRNQIDFRREYIEFS
ncbi:MAG TPA: hypothetical protein VGP47_07515 [Parachlamydiaceae bacterium]|nr:hypothetical protein [Parachlamydiaceae bacterium]